MAQFTHSLCEEVIRTEGRCGLSLNEITQMARLALRALKDENTWKGKYLKLLYRLENDGKEPSRASGVGYGPIGN
jgi:hypothetical protein